MNMKRLAYGLALLSAVLLTGCPGDGGSGPPTVTSPRLLGVVFVPNVNSSTVFSFDLAATDAATGLFYVTDRNNASVDVVNSANDTLVAQFKPGFSGCRNAALAPVAGCVGVVTANSGPNGLDLVTANAGTPVATIYADDANATFVLNRATGALIKKVVINGLGPCAAPCVGGPPVLAGAVLSGLRADEGCFDPTDNIYAVSSPNESPPFMTFIDTLNQNVIATVYFQSLGLEACVFDTVTGKFFVSNDGSAVNARGEITGIPGATIAAVRGAETATWPGGTQYTFGARLAATNPSPAVALPFPAAGVVAQPLGNCDPTGLILGPGTDIAVMCRQGVVGELLTFQIYNKTLLGPGNPALASLNIGGGDQVTYDAATDQYFLADSRWTATGTSCGGGSAACPLVDVLGIVKGTTRTIVAKVPSGGGAHAVGVVGGKVYMPYAAGTATTGGVGFDNGNNGGIAFFSAP